MKLRHILVLFCFLSACQDNGQPASVSSDVRVEGAEIEQMREVISREYSNTDEKYFTPWENCYFTNYIQDTTFLVSNYYDLIESGVLLKYFYCPYNNTFFTVIKGINGKLYYKGITERKHIIDLVEKEYKSQTGFYESLTGNLQLLDFNSDVFDQFLDSDTVFHVQEQWLSEEQQTSLIHTRITNLIYYTFFVKELNMTIKPLFDEVLDLSELEDALLNLKGPASALSEEEVNTILNPILNLGKDNLRNKVLIGKVSNLGLFVFHISKRRNRYVVNEMLIPALKMHPFPTSDLSYGGTYPACDKL